MSVGKLVLYENKLVLKETDSNKVLLDITPITQVKYGLLYNSYVATDENIAIEGWSVPQNEDWDVLFDYLGGRLNSGGKLKEIGLDYWGDPNVGATNEVNFNGRGGGGRYTHIPGFNLLKSSGLFWSKSIHSSIYYAVYNLSSGSIIVGYAGWNRKNGYSLRIFRSATEAEQEFNDGDACDLYEGNDGKVYRTVKIGTQVWLADNLCETKYRQGDPIPEVTDNTEWAALTTGAMCAYNNDWSNVLMD